MSKEICELAKAMFLIDYEKQWTGKKDYRKMIRSCYLDAVETITELDRIDKIAEEVEAS
jgi:hypothetical protein